MGSEPVDDLVAPATWTLVHTDDGYWRHVDHGLRLASSGWGSAEAAERNVGMYRMDAVTRGVMRRRYLEMFPAPAPKM